MTVAKLRLVLICTMLLMVTALGAVAQSSGTLALGLPASGAVGDQPLRFDYALDAASVVTIQAAGDTARPTITVLRDGIEIASAPNTAGVNTVTLDAALAPGSYVIEIGGAGGTAGQVIVAVQNERAIAVETLSPGVMVDGLVDNASPVALYDFGALSQAAYLYVESMMTEWGVDVTVINADTGQIVGHSSGDVLGARFRFPPANALYRVQIEASGAGTAEPFTVCLAFVAAGGCETPAVDAPPDSSLPTPVATEEVTAACTVSPNVSGGVNIRQSASTGSIIVGALPGGAVASVLGISPDNSFFNIQYNAINGWVAASVVSTSGSCVDLPTVNPPPVIAPPTATPPPTPTPIPASPTPSGPCLITLTAPTFIYTTTIEQVDYLYDQVQSGELIPVGRTADGAWYKTNYGNAWLPTRVIGQTVTRSGNCANLPVVTP